MFEKELARRNSSPAPREASSPQKVDYIYEFDSFQLDPTERFLTRAGEPVQLTPKAFDTLCVLVEHSGRLVSKNQLLETIWPGTYVEEKTLAQNVFTLRKALGVNAGGVQYIETVPKVGYRFSATVQRIPRRSVRLVRPADSREGGLSDQAHMHHLGAPVRAIDDPIKRSAEPTPAKTVRTGRLWTTGKPLLILGSVAIAIAAVMIAGLLLRKILFKTVPPFTKVQITKLTGTGDVGAIGLSRDGKYLAYVKRGLGVQSLVVRQIDSSSTLELLPPERVGLIGVTFAADGNSVFYVARPYGSRVASVYQISILGGTPRKIIDDADSPVALSPDGTRMAFVRQVPQPLERQLIIANAGGTEQRILTSSSGDTLFSLQGPAWSPDGQLIALSTATQAVGRKLADVLITDVQSGSVRALGTKKWTWVGQMAWSPRGGELMFPADAIDEPELSRHIWTLPYPKGEARRITNEIHGHFGIGVSADGGTIASTVADRNAALWVSQGRDLTNAKSIIRVSGDRAADILDLSWWGVDRILYSSMATGSAEIWTINSDGSGQRQISSDGGVNTMPITTPDEHSIVYVSQRNGAQHLWRMDANGANAKQLTTTVDDTTPSVTPDGKWVVYSAMQNNQPFAWKVSINGGESTRLSQSSVMSAVVSPDGKTIGCYLITPDAKRRLALLSFETGAVLKQFDVFLEYDLPILRWTPDGQALTYVKSTEGVSNIWSQPVSGGEPKQVTQWNSDVIFRFAWSKDGRLVVERGLFTIDAILIRPRD